MSTLIDPKRITEIVMDCLFNEDEIQNGNPKPEVEWTKAEGIMLQLGFVNSRLESHKEEIISILKNLDPSFFQKDGMSFLNFCQDKDGHLWGEHKNCDELICLGNALKLVKFTTPNRELWSMLPGSVPYIQVEI